LGDEPGFEALEESWIAAALLSKEGGAFYWVDDSCGCEEDGVFGHFILCGLT
jgi:hypothetical protein